MDPETYRGLLKQAAAMARSRQEAEDLVHEALLIGLEAGRGDLPWLSGVLRKRAAMLARSRVRQKRREAASAAETKVEAAVAIADPRSLLARLPPAACKVAVLALHGLSAEEIRWILQLSPAAFRQRLTSIRKAVGALPPPLRAEALALAYVRDPARSDELQFGLIRRALQAALPLRPGLGTHDHDGHLLIVHAHVSGPGGNE
jgi:RNA polymerase sigma-70 factor (ECF subfamily)